MTRIRIPAVNKLDRLELEAAMSDQVTFGPGPQVPGTAYGEPATVVATLLLSAAALRVLAVWLARRHSTDTITETFEVLHPDGRIEKQTLRVERKASESAEPAILRALGDLFKVDVSDALKVLGGS